MSAVFGLTVESDNPAACHPQSQKPLIFHKFGAGEVIKGQLENELILPRGYQRITLSVEPGKVAEMELLEIVSNSKNIEVYGENGDYICLLRGTQSEGDTFVARGDQFRTTAGAFGRLSFKFLSTRPAGSAICITSLAITLPSAPIVAPKKPEASDGGANGMAMMMMMLGAAGGAAGGTNNNVKIPPSAPIPPQKESSAGSSDTKKVEEPPQPAIGNAPAALPSPAMVNLVLNQVSGLLDAKLKPVMAKLDYLSYKVERLEGLLNKDKEEGEDNIITVEHVQRAPVSGKDGEGEEDPPANPIPPALASDMRSLLSALKKEGV